MKAQESEGGSAMASGQVGEFLTKIANDPAKRSQLRNALVSDLVEAGKAGGYSFTEDDLTELLQDIGRGSGSGETDFGTSIGWS